MEVETAAPTEASAKYNNAASITRRRPRRSPIRPGMGCSEAIAIRYDVTIHEVAATSTRRSRATCGSATTIMVEFSGTSRLLIATEMASQRDVTGAILGGAATDE